MKSTQFWIPLSNQQQASLNGGSGTISISGVESKNVQTETNPGGRPVPPPPPSSGG